MSIRLKLKWMMAVILVAVLGIIGYYSYSFLSFANRIHSDPGESRFAPTGNTPKPVDVYTPPKWEGKERVNVLLMGGDSRGLKENEIPRSDTIMVASIDPVTKKATLFSVLRDTYVKIPGYGEDRINAALALGGPDLAMKTVSDLLGIPIQYYVYTDFKGFIALIDAIGGIDYEVEKDMKYSDSEDGHEYDINLKKGMQHLDGKMALQYVRFRHDALSDFARTERQRNFLKAVAQKLQTSSSLIKLPKILSAIDPYIETNLSVTDMLKLGSLGFDAKAQTIEGVQIPPNELLEEKNIRGASVITVNPSKLQKFVQEQLENAGKPDDSSQNTQSGTKGGGAGTTASSPGSGGSSAGSTSGKSGISAGGTISGSSTGTAGRSSGTSGGAAGATGNSTGAAKSNSTTSSGAAKSNSATSSGAAKSNGGTSSGAAAGGGVTSHQSGSGGSPEASRSGGSAQESAQSAAGSQKEPARNSSGSPHESGTTGGARQESPNGADRDAARVDKDVYEPKSSVPQATY